MTKKKKGSPSSVPPSDAAARRPGFVVDGLEPFKIAEALEQLDSPYYQRYAAIRAKLLHDHGDEAVILAKLLDTMDTATLVEEATRTAAFVVGFECFRERLLGELQDLAALRARAK